MTDRGRHDNHHDDALVNDDANVWAGMPEGYMPVPSCQDPPGEIAYDGGPDCA